MRIGLSQRRRDSPSYLRAFRVVVRDRERPNGVLVWNLSLCVQGGLFSVKESSENNERIIRKLKNDTKIIIMKKIQVRVLAGF